MTKRDSNFVILAVVDGWGLAPAGPANAISQANTINMNRFWVSYPHTRLEAAGESVGLPRGEAGNTETGHLNLGAGQIVYQDLARINMSIADGTFFDNQALLGAINHAKKNGSKLHLMGLTGAGGVHSNIEHLFALIHLAAKQNFKDLYLHLFTDGRDSPPTSSNIYIANILKKTEKEGVGKIASIMGRYWAMDRDRRWERTAKAYFALTKGVGHLVKTPAEAVKLSYDQGKTDEFIEPALVSDASGKPLALITDNDAVIFYNFRIDRPRQLTKAFISKDFTKRSYEWDFDPYAVKYEKTHDPTVKRVSPSAPFDRGEPLKNLYFAIMTEYGKPLLEDGAKVVIPPQKIDLPLGRIISENNLKQLKVSESEKERFVTFYFNGQNENPFSGEERIILPSPKVPTYDQKPEMSANEITEALLNSLRNDGDFSFALINYANPDMVGHTGNIGPAVKACEVADFCLGKLANYTLAYGGSLIITADHGNVEEMINSKTGEIDTEHSTNPVPFIIVSKKYLGKGQTLQSGILADVAPTILGLLGIKPPDNMTGRDLLKELGS